MLEMNCFMDGKIQMTLKGVSCIEEDILDAEVLMVFRLEGDIEVWAVDPNITDEQAIAEVKRYYHESYGWDMNSKTFDFEKSVKFYLRRRP